MKPLTYTLLSFILAASAYSPEIATPVKMPIDASVLMYHQRGGQRLSVGSWGGKHIHMDVGEETIRIEFDCAHATASTILLDSRGRFAATATYVQEHGGPIREGDEEDRQEVLLKGTISGGTMKLRVTRDKEVLGNFVLTHGAASKIVKCL